MRTKPDAAPAQTGRAMSKKRSFRSAASALSETLHVRIGIDDVEYRVDLLTREGFSVVAAPPLPSGVVTHVSLRVGYGLSVSVQATARTWNPDGATQWYDFTNVDREVLMLLMLASAPASVQ